MGFAYKLIFFYLLQFLITTLHHHQLLPQDFADSMASHLSGTMSSCLFILLMARMFAFGQIECRTPSEWPEAWEHSAEAFCFVDGSYAVPPPTLVGNATNSSTFELAGPKTRLDYYYWIPYIFLAQAAMVKTPDFFWHFLCDLHPKKPAELVRAFAFLVGSQEVSRDDEEEDELDEALKLANCKERQRFQNLLSVHLLSRNKLVNFDTWHLFALYMTFKCLRLLALLLSLAFLACAFGLESIGFGFTMATDAIRGVPWERVSLFNRWGFCDVQLRVLGDWNTQTIQCALPLNLLAEKVLLFLWFWLVACALVLTVSGVTWSVRMLGPRRRGFVRAFLRARRAGRSAAPRRRREAELVDLLASVDRCFMLRLAEDRVGLASAYLAMDAMLDQKTLV